MSTAQYDEQSPIEGFYAWTADRGKQQREQAQQATGPLYGMEVEALRTYLDHDQFDDFQGVTVDDRLNLNEEAVTRIGKDGIYDDTTQDPRPVGVVYADMLTDYLTQGQNPLSADADADCEIGYALEHGTPPMHTADEAVAVAQEMLDISRSLHGNDMALLQHGYIPQEVSGNPDVSLKSRYSGYEDPDMLGDVVTEFNGRTASVQMTSMLDNVYDDWDETLSTAFAGNDERASLNTLSLLFVPPVASSAVCRDGELREEWGRHTEGWKTAIGNSHNLPDAAESRYGVPDVGSDDVESVEDYVEWVMEKPPIFWGKHKLKEMEPVDGMPVYDRADHLSPDSKGMILAKYDAPNRPTTTTEAFFEDQQLNGWVYFEDDKGESSREEVNLDWSDMDRLAFYEGPGKQAYLYREGTLFPHTRPRLFVPGVEVRPYPFNDILEETSGIMENLLRNGDDMARYAADEWNLYEDRAEDLEQDVSQNLGSATLPDGTPVSTAAAELAENFFNNSSEASRKAKEHVVAYANDEVTSPMEQDVEAFQENGMDGFKQRLYDRVVR